MEVFNDQGKPLMREAKFFWWSVGIWMAVAPSASAHACAIGPVAFEAPACETASLDLEDARETYAEWKDEAGVSYQVMLFTPKRALKVSGYLERWRHSHKCSARTLQIGEATRFQARAGEGASPQAIPPQATPSQITWGGSCAGGDFYIARAVSVGKQIVVLSASKFIGSQASLDEAFVRLLNQAKLSPVIANRKK
jgi:hypothetical protein